MLSLTRRVGESIVVAHDVTIRVVEAGRGRVRLEVDAPGEIPVNRSEVEAERHAAGVGRCGRFVSVEQLIAPPRMAETAC